MSSSLYATMQRTRFARFGRAIPIKAHWGLPDPASVTGDDAAVDAAFEAAHDALTKRFAKLVELPIIDREVPALAVRLRLQAIHDDLAEDETINSGNQA